MSFFTDLLGGSSNLGGQMAASEAQRRGLINQGTSAINAVFQGGTAPIYSAVAQGAKYDPTQQYYRIRSPIAGDQPGAQAGLLPAFQAGKPGMFNKFMRQNNLYTMTPQTFQGFGNDFLNQYQQSYINQALPQVAQQYRQNRNAMIYGLGNRGLTKSMAAGQQQSDLAQQLGQAQQTVASGAISARQGLQQQLENAQTQQLNQLYQSADPGQASKSAIQTAAGFSPQSSLPQLGDLFGTFANQYALNQVIGAGAQQPLYYSPGGYQNPTVPAPQVPVTEGGA